jgi:predicted RecB family nuclease
VKDLKKNHRICKKGHHYYKRTDCPACPVCEQEQKPEEGFLSLIVAPARRALESAGIKTLEELSRHSEKEILTLHGMGPSTIPKLRKALALRDFKFRKQE